MVVGRDAVVPLISTSNSMIYTINEKGIAPEKLAVAVTQAKKQNWGTLLGSNNSAPLTLYLPYNGHVSEIVAEFLGTPLSKLNFVTVASEKELIAAIQKDPNGIGFSKIINVFNEVDQSLPENTMLMPIDKNGNGKLDYYEKIYDNWQSFLRGVWIGKYPHSLCQSIYTVASVKPENKAEVDFLKWVLTTGQVYLNDYGYFDLVYSDRQSGLDKLAPNEMVIAPAKGVSTVSIALMTLGLLIVIGILIGVLASYVRGRRKSTEELRLASAGELNVNTVKVMEGLYFDRSHTWSFMEKNGSVRVGVDDFLQHVTGPITCIKMKKSGEKITKGEVFLSIIQDGKRLNIKSPLTGTIKEHNDFLFMNAALINSAPYAEGWIYMIEPSNWIREIQSLIMADRYKIWIGNELSRLKDFLASSLKEHRLELSAVALQDGGPLHDHVLAGLGPEIWDDFQTNYLDTAV